MKILQTLVLVFVSLTLLQCSSSKKTSEKLNQTIQKDASFSIGSVYYQKWVAGIQGGGSGINLYIPIQYDANSLVLDSAYFRGMVAKIEKGNTHNVARFKTLKNQKEDVIMSGNTQDEYGNSLPNKVNIFPFELEDDECVISYKEQGVTKFYKATSIVEKQTQQYPSAPRKR